MRMRRIMSEDDRDYVRISEIEREVEVFFDNHPLQSSLSWYQAVAPVVNGIAHVAESIAAAQPEQYVDNSYNISPDDYLYKSCMLCGRSFKRGECVGLVNCCSHPFHNDCIRHHLSYRKNCPYCLKHNVIVSKHQNIPYQGSYTAVVQAPPAPPAFTVQPTPPPVSYPEPRYDDKSQNISPEDYLTKTCSICHSVFQRGNCVGILNCGDFFHNECVQSRLNIQKTCPKCGKNGVIIAKKQNIPSASSYPSVVQAPPPPPPAPPAAFASYPAASSGTKKCAGETCAICICEYERGETVIELSCHTSHFFHKECIDQWKSSKNSCPMCRKNISGSRTLTVE
jgi:hypothetical protein